jgi:hypothetical protein
MIFVSSLSVDASSRIQLMLSVLGDSLILLRGRICLCLYGRCSSICLDLSMECLNTYFGEAVCEICISQFEHPGSLRTDQVCYFVSEIKLVDGKIWISVAYQSCS